MEKRAVSAGVVVTLEFPDEMADALKEVLEGKNESGYSGENLTILKIGANIGFFALWAICAGLITGFTTLNLPRKPVGFYAEM